MRLMSTKKLWEVVIYPDEYDDPSDVGYGDTVEARSEDRAVAKVCRGCEADNGWERGTLKAADIAYTCEPGQKQALRETVANYDAAYKRIDLTRAPLALRKALDYVAKGHVVDFVEDV